MKRALYLKFIIGYLAFGLISFLIIALFSSRATMNALIKEQSEFLYKESNLISTEYAESFYSGRLSSTAVSGQLVAIDTFTSSEIWIIDDDGNLRYSSRKSSDIEDLSVPDFNPTDSGNNYYMIGDFYGHFNEDMLSVYSPIYSGFISKGYVVMHYSMNALTAKREQILSMYYISLGILFALSLIILVVFTFAVYRPIRKITHATHEYAEGNLQYELKINKKDEIGYLADSLNYMAKRLSRTEEDQKKFIANVSHDFRSPLTSIRGYLVAMVDGTIPPEMHDKYLNVVLNETERLTKLTNSLLTLNNMSTKGMLLEISDFDINSVIKNTTATFEGVCKEKKIKIKLVLTGETLHVTADMGKIQQVLYNLLDNAIKFSGSGKEIKIETTIKNDTVFISVKDKGIGIPKDNVKYIFDRFYKTDLSRGKDKKGTGLGLSIVKEIIKAHNENINVISTEGVGTEFIFTLPKSKEIED